MPFLAVQSLVTMIALAALAVFPAGAGPFALLADDTAALQIVSMADGFVLSTDGRFTVAVSDRPGFAARLYAAGATIVLPASFAGSCGTRAIQEKAR